MKGGRWAAGALVVVAMAAFAVGCGSGDQTADTVGTAAGITDATGTTVGTAVMPSPRVVADCFRANGATSVYQRKEGDVILVDGLTTSGIVSVELTGNQAKSEKVIDELTTENSGSFQAFEALDGAVVGVYSKGDAAGKRFIGRCLNGSSSPVPTPEEVAACFKREGAVSVYQRKDRGVRFVNGLVNGANAVSAEFTGDQAKTDEFLRRYEAEEPSELEAFEVLDGAAVGVINEREPANKRIVIGCLEGRAR